MNHLKNYQIIIPVLLGIIVFAFYFDFTILEPTNTAWVMLNGGDGAINQVASYAFRIDSWHFPITKTELINYPEGLSIIYTDANPLFSILAKLFRGIFPPSFQFFGIWLFMCYILQSVLGYLLVKKITNNYVYACLAGLLFCLLPTQIFRVFHPNLQGFWLILWMIYIFINDEISISIKQILFLVIFSISSMVHGYFVIMNLFIGMTWYISNAWIYYKEKQWKFLYRFISINFLYGSIFILFLWVLGYFYNTSKSLDGLQGYGYYSMNLNSPLSTHDIKFTNFLSQSTINDGQYEGYQYLGLGILIMIFFVSLLNLKENKTLLKSSIGLFLISLISLPLFIKYNENSISTYDRISLIIFIFFYITVFYSLYKQKENWLFLLIVPATICFVHALSNKIAWGTVTIFECNVNDHSFYSGFLRSSRSSGRFFWVTSQILLLLGIVAIFRNLKSAKYSIAILSIIIAIQLFDLSKLSYVVDSNNKERILTIDSTSKGMILGSKQVCFIPNYNIHITEVALLNKIPLNKFYTTHGTGQITLSKWAKEDSCFKNYSLNSDHLYLFHLNDMPWNKTMEIYPAFWGNYWAILPNNFKSGKTKTILVNKIKSDSLDSLIKLIQTKEMVVISVKDEASNSLPKEFSEKFNNLFGSNIKNLGFRHHYIAIFKGGKLMKEVFETEKDVDIKDSFNDETIQIKSSHMQSSILLNNIDYSSNERGLNFVSIEKTIGNKNLISTGSFDTYENKYEYK